MILNVIQHKGGVGATALRCALAVEAAAWGHRALVVDDDAAAMLGLANAPDVLTAEVVEATSRVHVACALPRDLSDYGVLITDRKTEHVCEEMHRLKDRTILATRGCYLALRRSVHDEDTRAMDGFVLLDEPGRSLGSRDAEDVLAIPCLTTVPYDMAIARAIDAGVLVSRVPRPLGRAADQLLRWAGIEVVEVAS